MSHACTLCGLFEPLSPAVQRCHDLRQPQAWVKPIGLHHLVCDPVPCAQLFVIADMHPEGVDEAATTMLHTESDDC